MDKSKDGVFQICRFELHVRVSRSPPNPRFGTNLLRCTEGAGSGSHPHAMELTHIPMQL